MTFGAWDPLMSALQAEAGILIMIKFRRLPVRWCMTVAAIGRSTGEAGLNGRVRKLPAMNILMAILTGNAQSGELQLYPGRRCFDRFMTGTAIHLLVTTGQGELGAGMIKSNSLPGFGVVAEGASVLFHKFFYIPLMGIAVAALTIHCIELELYGPGAGRQLSRFMAGDARNRQMRAGQLKIGLPVLLDRKSGGSKPIDGMAFGAVAAGGAPGKLPAMEIRMAVQTAGVLQPLQRFSRSMALLTL